jgi:uncharacterized protein
MEKAEIIKRTADFVQEMLEKEGTGHDWKHAERVWKTAKHLAQQEGADFFICEIAALLHDVADWKLNNGDEKAGLKKVEDWLVLNAVEKAEIEKILYVIDNMSYSKETTGTKLESLEGFVVQDADRLDTLGAIGIARTFIYGAKHNRALYDPQIKPRTFDDFEEYKKYITTSINHFYEKILLLKDLMKTKEGKRIAQQRHEFVEKFLQQFLKEWNCEFYD